MPKLLRRIGVLSAVFCALAYAEVHLAEPAWSSNSARETALSCDHAAIVASRETGVPIDVLRAISLTETGRNGPDGFRPWPWTVNMEGAGRWFDEFSSAKSYVDQHFSKGARSFDVGCFQINYRWHGQAFASIEEMFEPTKNARYAAKFLKELYAEFGDWSKAAGAYHSRTPKYAKRYTARFDRIRGRLTDVELPIPETQVAEVPKPVSEPPVFARVNNFPLLKAGAPGAIGSLFPTQDTPSVRFLDMRQETSSLEFR